MIKIPSIHLNSEYSLLESTIRIDSLISWAKKEKLDSLVLTDHNTMFGVAEFVQKCKKNNIKPIVGLDLDVEDYRLILLAKNFNGYKHLSFLSSKKMKNEEIVFNDIVTNDIFVIDHPIEGYYAKKGTFLKSENYFIGTTSKEIENAVLVNETKIMNISENEAIDILNSIKNGGSMLKEKANFIPYSSEADQDDFRVKNLLFIQNNCNIKFLKNSSILPKFPTPNKISSPEYFKQLIDEGFKKYLDDVENKDIYLERVKYEVKIIEELNFTDYFLIIWDLIIWSKSKGIAVGPGRGSASGSLVSYLLNITEVDPIKFGLLFERFLNPQRVSMPDIDIDIQDNRRDEVIDYLFEKYGYENVGLVSTFQRLGAKMAIRDCARALNIPLRDANSLSKLIPKSKNSKDTTLNEAYKKSAKFRAYIDKTEEFTKLFNSAKLIEGLPRQQGTHAAGIVISNSKLIEKVPTIKGLNDLNQVQYTKDYLEDFNLLKIDLLGLRNLTILQRIQEEIYINYKKRVDLKNISYEDKMTNELLSNGDTNGIFQLESYGMRQTVSQVKISSLDDIVAIISLYRPGPMEYIPLYANRKNKGFAIDLIAPEYDKIVEPTYGIIIYQEQIMHIAQEFAGMSFAEADILRRAISKKKIKQIEELKQKFFSGAKKKGNTSENINEVFMKIEKFANYGFNKSHAVAYSILAYRLAFLKARFPFEFYTALIESSIGSQTTTKKYINEAKSKNIIIISPNVNSSLGKVTNLNKEIILPLTMIKGFGDVANRKILKERENGFFEDFFEFVARVKNIGIGESIISTLIESGSLRDFGNTQTLINSLPSALRYSSMVTITKDGIKKIDLTIIAKPTLIDAKEDVIQNVLLEDKLFGFMLSTFPTSRYETKDKISNIEKNGSKTVAVFVEKIKTLKDKNNNEMAKISVSDSTSKIELVIFAGQYKNMHDINPGIIVEAEIRKTEYKGKDSYNLQGNWKVVKNE